MHKLKASAFFAFDHYLIIIARLLLGCPSVC